jgi:hypothetical protein
MTRPGPLDHLQVRLADGDEREALTDQLWAVEAPGVNATVIPQGQQEEAQ